MSILSAVCAFGQMISDSFAASSISCNDYDYYDWKFCENVSLEQILETAITAFESTCISLVEICAVMQRFSSKVANYTNTIMPEVRQTEWLCRVFSPVVVIKRVGGAWAS